MAEKTNYLIAAAVGAVAAVSAEFLLDRSLNHPADTRIQNLIETVLMKHNDRLVALEQVCK